MSALHPFSTRRASLLTLLDHLRASSWSCLAAIIIGWLITSPAFCSGNSSSFSSGGGGLGGGTSPSGRGGLWTFGCCSSHAPWITFACVHIGCVWLFAVPWTVACQAPLPFQFSRLEYWSGLLFSLPGDLLHPGIKSVSLVSPALAGGFFTTESLGKPLFGSKWWKVSGNLSR